MSERRLESTANGHRNGPAGNGTPRPAGQQVLTDKRNARTEQLARALSSGFTPAELRQLKTAAPLLERLAQSI